MTPVTAYPPYSESEFSDYLEIRIHNSQLITRIYHWSVQH